MKKSLALIFAAAGLALAIPGAAASAAPSKSAYTEVGGRLYGVVAPGANDVWAVGLAGGGSLIMHWDGSTWSQNPTAIPGFLYGAAATSPHDVWAVGGTNWGNPTQTLAEHWNGRQWTQVATPTPGGSAFFLAAAAASPSSAWAVGLAGPGPGVPAPATTPLIEHWNGRHWAVQSIQVPAAGGQFDGVSALSPSNAWAVGYTGGSSEGTNQRTLIEHWNGRTWTRVPTPAPGSSSFVQSVTAISSDNVWAVGFYVAGSTQWTLVLNWNGKHWTRLPSPTPGGDAKLLGVTATWKHNIWAVGMTNPSRCGHGPNCGTLIEHWNSVRWKVIPSPNPPAGYLNLLWGVVAVNRASIWAVGTTDYASTLIAHWNGTSWS